MDVMPNTHINIVSDCLVFAIPADFNINQAKQLRQNVLNAITNNKICGIIIDFSDVQYIDSYEISEIIELSKMIKLLGFAPLMVGFKPAVVATIINMGIDTSLIKPFRSIDQGVEFLNNNK